MFMFRLAIVRLSEKGYKSNIVPRSSGAQRQIKLYI